ncbi:hypothetical protein SDJN03_04462, partial [Cucurbita argyrosperma subsp. sororia]
MESCPPGAMLLAIHPSKKIGHSSARAAYIAAVWTAGPLNDDADQDRPWPRFWNRNSQDWKNETPPQMWWMLRRFNIDLLREN